MKKIILLLLCLGFSIIGQAQTTASIDKSAKMNEVLSWTKFTIADGLPTNAIKDILIDKTGYLWIATSLGVSRYNGTTFQNYTTADGLHSNAIARLYCDHLNRIWAIGDYNNEGLSVYTDAWHPFAFNSSVPKPGFLFQDQLNNIYIIEGAGNIYKYDGTQIQFILQSPIQKFSSALYDQNGIMWALGYEKLYKYSGSSLLETQTLTSNGVGSFYLIEKDRLNKLWILMGNSLYKSDDLATFNIIGTTWNYYMDVAFDSNNNLFLGRYSKASGGIKTYIGTTWGEYTASSGLTGQTVQAVAIDANDNVWAGADDGLYKSSGSITSTQKAIMDSYVLFPNPLKDVFQLSSFEGLTDISILDLQGEVLYKNQIKGSGLISMITFKPGVYFVKLQSNNGTLIKKIIKK